jgi:hypothetical protein
LLQRCNETFVPAAELRISVYARPGMPLTLRTGAGVGFFRQSIFEPGEPQCAMPAALLMALPQRACGRGQIKRSLHRNRRVATKPFSSPHDKILKRTVAIVWPGSTGFKRDFAPCRMLNWLKFGVPLKIAGLKTCPVG